VAFWFTWSKPHDVLSSCVKRCIMNSYRKRDHGISLTQIGVVNVLRYNLKIECCKNLNKCKGGMTFVEVLEENTVLVCFEKVQSRYCEICNHFTVYFFRVKRERNFLTFSGIFKTCSNSGLHFFNRCSSKRVSL